MWETTKKILDKNVFCYAVNNKSLKGHHAGFLYFFGNYFLRIEEKRSRNRRNGFWTIKIDTNEGENGLKYGRFTAVKWSLRLDEGCAPCYNLE